MVDESLVKEIKEILEAGAESAESDDVLKIFEVFKQIAEEVDYLKEDTKTEEIIGQVTFSDVDKSYWFNASNGKVEYGEGKIENPLFTLTSSKEIGLGLFMGDVDANIVSPLGKLQAGGKFTIVRAFQEFYEDAIEEFKKRY
ncbi:MAG: hypothetical protein ACXAES_07950 [Promethearchaeota archaeon]|jgi:hypothetical protein